MSVLNKSLPGYYGTITGGELDEEGLEELQGSHNLDHVPTLCEVSHHLMEGH